MSRFVLSAFGDEIDPNIKIQMDVLERYNIKYIEIRGVDGKNISQHTISEVKEIKKQLDERGFKISAIGSPIGKKGISEDFGPQLDLFKHVLEIAKLLETPYIRIFSFYIPKGEDPAIYRSQVMQKLDQFITLAKKFNVVLLHENEKNIYGDTAKRCLDLLKTMNSNYFKATFDPANFIQCNIETYPYAYNLLKNYIVYMHMKDATNDASLLDRKVVPSGYGDGKIKEILQELHNKGFEGFLSIEPHLGAFQGLANLKLDSKVNNLLEGRIRKFDVAARALEKIINEVTDKI